MVFEDSLLAFSSAESLLPGWSVYFTKQHFLLCGDTMESPLQSDSPVPVCRFVFHVKEDAAAGSALSVLLENFTVTDGGQPVAPGDPSFSGRIAFPDTGKARLRALSAGDYPMTPAFSPDLFSYTVRDLPHDLETLPLSYTPSSEGLTVTENFPSLADGKTVLTLTVTAEDGSETVYTVTALRKFGDGYQPSSEGRVGSLVPSAGTLSPPFSPDCTEYILYLPAEYAGKTLTLVPTPLSDSAEAEAVTAMLGAEEKDGDARKDVSLLSVVCMAEDGSEVAYEVTAMLLPPYEGVPPYVESGTALQGTLEIEQTGDGYFARTALSRPDGRYDLRWSFNGADLGSGETLPRQDGLRDGVLTATLTGRDGFSGELCAEVTLDGEGNLTDKTGDTPSAVDPRAAAIVCGASVAALAIGFLGRDPGGKTAGEKASPAGKHRLRTNPDFQKRKK